MMDEGSASELREATPFDAMQPDATGQAASENYPFTEISPEDAEDGRSRPQVVVTPLRAEAEPGEGADPERERLDDANFYYRGTPAGAWELTNLYRRAHPQDGEEETPARKAEIAFYRPLYGEVAADLIRFDRLTAIENATSADARASSPALEIEFAHPLLEGSLLMRTLLVNGQAVAALQTDPLRRWEEIKSVQQENADELRVALEAVRVAGLPANKYLDFLKALIRGASKSKPPATRPPRNPKGGGEGPPPPAPLLPNLPRPRGAPQIPDVPLLDGQPAPADDESRRQLLEQGQGELTRDDLPSALQEVLDILAPRGKLIGEARQTGVRTAPGGTPAAAEMFRRISRIAKRFTPARPYEGSMVEFPSGGTIGLRLKSSSEDTALDVNIPLFKRLNIPGFKSLRKFHFPE